MQTIRFYLGAPFYVLGAVVMVVGFGIVSLGRLIGGPDNRFRMEGWLERVLDERIGS